MMLRNCRRRFQAPLEFANPAQAVLQRCQYSLNILVRWRAMQQSMHNGTAFMLAAALSFD
jgi:hypothetical protein